MSILDQLFRSAWYLSGHLSKKAYTTGIIAFSGVVAMAVILMGVNGFTGSISAVGSSLNNNEEDNKAVIEEMELMTVDITAEKIMQRYAAWDKAYYELAEAERISRAVAKLAKEENTEKTLKISANLSKSNIPELSDEDYTALLRIVEAEATDEDLIGKILVANVVINRVNSTEFPDSIYDVVHQRINGRVQFSPIADGRYYSVKVTASTEEAVAQALEGADYSDGALFFVAKSMASKSASSWFDRNLTFVVKHGVHSFYKY